MKSILIYPIRLYQKIPLPSHAYCKFYPTCSEYAIEALERYGSMKGSFLAIKRILRCNPWNKGGIDLVPIEEKK